MNELSQLKQLGIELPSPAYLAGALLFGLIGWVAFRMGRKNGQRVTLWLGVALMVYPYGISSTWLLYVMGCALCLAIFVDQKRE